MASFTIHALDEPTMELLKQRAKMRNLSVNRTVKEILEAALGVRPKEVQEARDRFSKFCGKWTKTELKEFESATSDFSIIDEEEW